MESSLHAQFWGRRCDSAVTDHQNDGGQTVSSLTSSQMNPKTLIYWNYEPQRQDFCVTMMSASAWGKVWDLSADAMSS